MKITEFAKQRERLFGAVEGNLRGTLVWAQVVIHRNFDVDLHLVIHGRMEEQERIFYELSFCIFSITCVC